MSSLQSSLRSRIVRKGFEHLLQNGEALMLELIVEAEKASSVCASGTGLMAQSPFSSCRQQHQYHLPLTCFARMREPQEQRIRTQSLPWVTACPTLRLLHQCLYLVESFPWNDGRMCSYCVILFMLTGVFVAGRRKCIAGVGFSSRESPVYFSLVRMYRTEALCHFFRWPLEMPSSFNIFAIAILLTPLRYH